MVSEVVDTETVSDADAVEGLVTPLSTTLTASPAATESPLKIPHVAVAPSKQAPTCWSVVVGHHRGSSTVPFVPDGNVIVIWLASLPADHPSPR